MKTHYLTIVFLVLFFSTQAQFGSEQLITTDLGAEAYTFDLNGDGDLDVLMVNTSTLAWFENLDGLGGFGIQHLIEANNFWSSIYASDLDGDGDLDVLSIFEGGMWQDDTLIWFENLDGLGNFGSPQEIAQLNLATRSVYSVDLDGDGDMDVLSASHTKVVWYKNIDGQGNFSLEQIITSSVSIVKEIYAKDLDGDGDMDVLSASVNDNKVAWYENIDGQGNFGSQQIISTDVNEAWSVDASDLDGDGDMDVLSASWGDGKIAWYENVDGNGNFGIQQIISTDISPNIKVYTSDLDGDIDVLSANLSSANGKIAWCENTDGNGNFGPQQILLQNEVTGLFVNTGDIDSDGDMDVLASGGDIFWLENLHPLSINDNLLLDFYFSPNPVKDVLNIENTSNIKITSIKMYDALGRLVMEENSNVNQLDISRLNRGLLFVKMKTDKGVLTKKIIKE